MSDIREIILKSDLSEQVKTKSINIFENLAKAEGKIHNRPPEDVHFHELGAVDSIIDIVGTVFAIECMCIDSISASTIPLGSGFVDCAHGRMPVPAPATLDLLKGIPVFDSGVSYEMVTPTGAALVTGLAKSFGTMPPMTIHEVGYGVGSRDLPDRPNLLRLLIGEQNPEQNLDTVLIIETDLDDVSPEWLGYIMDRLFEAGALDVTFHPVHMKKNRPGTHVEIIGRPEQKDSLMDILFRESMTLGIRFRYSQRSVLERSVEEMESPWGIIRVKKVVDRHGATLILPEYEACREAALKTDRPLRDIFCWIMGLNRS